MSHNGSCLERRTTVGGSSSQSHNPTAHTETHACTPPNTHIAILMCWSRRAASWLSSLAQSNSSVDALRHNSSASDAPPNSPGRLRTRDYRNQYGQCVPDSRKYPLKGLKGRIRFLLFRILRGAAHIVLHPLRQLLRWKSCPT